jgi:DNA topoisomerase-1
MWQENINDNYKYVMLGADSDIKGQSDFKKFEKARELKKHIDKIRRDYTKDLKSEVMADRQRATAMYFIDKLALRAGNEKDTENEADTVGCCSLKYEHITLEPPNKVTFDFLGKDSIPYRETAIVEPQVFKNLKLFKKAPKSTGDDLFDRLTVSSSANITYATATNKFIDLSIEQALEQLHEGVNCQGLPYLQRFLDNVRAAQEACK